MEKITARLVIEIMGRPPEHVKEALNTVVVKIGSEEGVDVIDKKYFDPKPIEEVKNLYTAFAEIEVEFQSIENFFGVVFNYMPSNVEIYHPEKFKLSSHNLNEISNYVASKLHHYDALAKRLVAERDILLKHLQYIKDGGKIEDIMKDTERIIHPKRIKEPNKVKRSKKKKKPKVSRKKK